MTFEEWKQKNYKMWNTEQAYMLACEGTPEEENAVDKYSKMIWEASQPKWTYCKDGLPDNDSWVLVYMPETEDFEAMICTAYYTSGDWQSEWDTNQHPISAWMPLPEAPGNIDK